MATDLNETLEKAMSLFRTKGFRGQDDEQIAVKLGISLAEFQELFGDKSTLVNKAVKHDLSQRTKRQNEIQSSAENAVDEMLLRINETLKSLKEMHPGFYEELMEDYPDTWNHILEYIQSNTYQQTYRLLDKGVRQGYFRKDINLDIVTKVIMENVKLLSNTKVFPPNRYQPEEVYRGIYMYYIRGFCTEDCLSLTDEFFARN